jgi:alpha-beta hydrolase superfamily lysophospholipase
VKSWDPADYGIPPEQVTEEWFETPDGEFLYGWYCRSKAPIASALFCHGNTGNLTTLAGIAPYLLEAGYNVLFFDYRGFGRSTGRASIGGVVADGVTAARFHETLRPKELPSILFGFSLGGAIAAQVIRHHHFDGLIMQSTFTSLPDITRVIFPRMPFHFFAGRFFDSIATVQHLRVPLLLIHGTEDEVVPAWMSRTLYEACSSKKKLHLVDAGLHKDLFDRDSEALMKTITDFVKELPIVPVEERMTRAPEPSCAVDELIDSALRYVRRFLRRRPPMHAKAL